MIKAKVVAFKLDIEDKHHKQPLKSTIVTLMAVPTTPITLAKRVKIVVPLIKKTLLISIRWEVLPLTKLRNRKEGLVEVN